MIDPAARDRRLEELLRKYHGSRANRVLVFALYKKEAARLEVLLQRRGWKVGLLAQGRTASTMSLATPWRSWLAVMLSSTLTGAPDMGGLQHRLRLSTLGRSCFALRMSEMPNLAAIPVPKIAHKREDSQVQIRTKASTQGHHTGICSDSGVDFWAFTC